MAGLYIHIPFCESRCIYCDFYSTTQEAQQDRYVEALCQELRMRHSELSEPLHTIYLGGGTPSRLSRENLHKIFQSISTCFEIELQNSDMEITMECNPDDITPRLFEGLPINRVSMGIQTFDDARLRFLHRRHTAQQAVQAVEMVRHAGIDNISIDLIFGFPKQQTAQWLDDIERALALGVPHISAYNLMYEEGTPLYKQLCEGKVQEVDEEVAIEMFRLLISRLTQAGYEHYEISNFALPGKRSRHNGNYWNDTPYIGLGASAHSYIYPHRSWNVAHLLRYMKSIEQGTLPLEQETIDETTHYNDTITTALRTSQGIALEKLSATFRSILLRHAQPYIERGDLQLADGHLRLTEKGIFISNLIMSDLMEV